MSIQHHIKAHPSKAFDNTSTENEKFNEYLKTLEYLADRSNLFSIFYKNLPEKTKEHVRLVNEKSYIPETMNLIALEVNTFKKNYYSFVRCNQRDLWFFTTGLKEKNAPILILTHEFFESFFLSDIKSQYYLKYDDEIINIHSNLWNGFVIKDEDGDVIETKLLSCFSQLDISNIEGTCAFNSFIYSLLSDEDVRLKFKNASEKIIHSYSQTFIASAMLEAISYFNDPEKFDKKCKNDQLLYFLWKESDKKESGSSFNTKKELKNVLKKLIEVYNNYIDFLDIKDLKTSHAGADILYIEDEFGFEHIDISLTYNSLEYELIGVNCHGPEHSMAISRCAFDPTLWQFHDSGRSYGAIRYFMFRGTNISFFGKNAEYKFYCLNREVIPVLAFYKKKDLQMTSDFKPKDLYLYALNHYYDPFISKYTNVRFTSDNINTTKLQQTCEYDFENLVYEADYQCENTFVQTIFGNNKLRSILKNSQKLFNDENKIQQIIKILLHWFEIRKRDLCPENLESIIRGETLMRFGLTFKDTSPDILIKGAIQLRCYDFLRDFLIHNQKNVNVLTDVQKYYFLRESVQEKNKNKIALAIIFGTNPYLSFEKNSSIIDEIIQNKDFDMYQEVFNMFQTLQPGLAYEQALQIFPALGDSNKNMFCDRYDIMYKKENKNYSDTTQKIYEIIEKEDLKKFAALYTLLKPKIKYLNADDKSNDIFDFFSEQIFSLKRGIFLSTRHLREDETINTDDINCEQINGILLFHLLKDNPDILYFQFIGGENILVQMDLIRQLFKFAGHAKYSFITSLLKADKNFFLMNLGFKTKITKIHGKKIFYFNLKKK